MRSRPPLAATFLALSLVLLWIGHSLGPEAGEGRAPDQGGSEQGAETLRASEPLGESRVYELHNAVQAVGHDRGDLAFLRDLIEENGLGEDSSGFDGDDGDGVFTPPELGHQVWEERRLVELRTGPDPYLSYGYGIERLPESVRQVSRLRVLDLHTNRLRSLPPGLFALRSLAELRLHRNELRELPREIWGLRSLRVLVLSQNRLVTLPREIGELDALQELYLANNPLRSLPRELGRLGALRILALNREPATGAGLEALPRALEDLRGLEALHLAGNALACGREVRLPDYLHYGSVGRVVGLDLQRCPPHESES